MPSSSHHREVLNHGDWAHVAQILAAHDGCVPVIPSSVEQASVCDSLKNALAVFMTRPGVAESQRRGQAFDRGVGFIDDDRRAARPVVEPLLD